MGFLGGLEELLHDSVKRGCVCWGRMSQFTVVYPGTFDPLTNGHLDLIARGAKIADSLVIAVLRSSTKPEALFSVEERVEMLREATAGYRNVAVTEFDGLLVDFARGVGAQAILRGIRAVSDYEYELQMALMNRKLAPDVETLFLIPAEQYTFVSSRLIKGVARMGGDVSALVPAAVHARLVAKAREHQLENSGHPVAMAEANLS